MSVLVGIIWRHPGLGGGVCPFIVVSDGHYLEIQGLGGGVCPFIVVSDGHYLEAPWLGWRGLSIHCSE